MTTDERGTLRTEFRVEVEVVCHGATWEDPRPGVTIRNRLLRRADGVLGADTRPNLPGEVRFRYSDPTSDIGAAMALVDGLIAEVGLVYADFDTALECCLLQVHPQAQMTPFMWWLLHCPPPLRPLVLTLAVLAARGGEWRRYLPLLTEDVG